MRIIYVGRHNSGGNDDEGAVSHALESLGHEVVRLDERLGYRAVRTRADLVLSNKWFDYHTMVNLKTPKVFWYWDLVNFNDYTLEARNAARRRWMADVLPLVDLGFCTDGDWVEWPEGLAPADRAKLVWLTQGADQRNVGPGPESIKTDDVVMFGIARRGGLGRESFVNQMVEWYGGRFTLVERGVHGGDAKKLIGRSKVVVAPDSPVTNRYWSNRLYVMLSHGAFLLHPSSRGAETQYADGVHLRFYRDREHLRELVEHYKSSPAERAEIARAGAEHTREHHTYVNRVRELLAVVRDRLGVG